jgi:hypothetical protein
MTRHHSRAPAKDPSHRGPKAPDNLCKGSTMKITKLALIAASTVAATIASSATARAVVTDEYNFQTPSGNIGCTMLDQGGDTGVVATCKTKDHTWVAPSQGSGHDCEYGGPDLKLFQGDPACAGVWPNQIWLQQRENTLPTLAYGQTHTLGTITCDSALSGVTCTDSGTGHFFRVSRDSYQLG